jgi:hypothetical protein
MNVDSIAHAAATVIGEAVKQLETTGTVKDSTQTLLRQARISLRSLCPECAKEDKNGI